MDKIRKHITKKKIMNVVVMMLFLAFLAAVAGNVILQPKETILLEASIEAVSEGAVPDGAKLEISQLSVQQSDNAVDWMKADAEDFAYQAMLSETPVVLNMTDSSASYSRNKESVDMDVLLAIQQMDEKIAGNPMVAVPLEINLVQSGKTVEPDGAVRVTLDLPEGMSGDYTAVYYVAENGSVTKMDGELITDGDKKQYSFMTTHFSKYVIVSVPDTTEASTELTQASVGQTLNAGKVYTVSEDLTLDGAINKSNGLVVGSDTTAERPAVLWIKNGVTLEVKGASGNANGAPGYAAILLQSGDYLYVRGSGSLEVTGGDGARGKSAGRGEDAGDSVDTLSKKILGVSIPYGLKLNSHAGDGGAGGTGSGGGGAAIGTNGARGGTGGSGGTGDEGGATVLYVCPAPPILHNIKTDGENGQASPGRDGASSVGAGTLYVLDNIRLSGKGGSAGTAGSAGGSGNSGSHMTWYLMFETGGDGAGGGAGGQGGDGAFIGSGGAGAGGGGGGGAGGYYQCYWNLRDAFGTDLDNYSTGEGGIGGTGTTSVRNGVGTWNRGFRGVEGGSGGAGGSAGSSGAGGNYYLASTVECDGTGSSGGAIHGNPATKHDIETTQTTYANNAKYTLALNTAKPEKASSTPVPASIDNIEVVAGINYNTATGKTFTEKLKGWTFNGFYSEPSGGELLINKYGYFLTSYTSDYLDRDGAWCYPDDYTLYAQYEPNIYEIKLDNMGAETAGTESLFLKYDHDWYLSRANAKADTDATTRIEIPTLPGYTFDGYYTGMGGSGDCIIKEDGSLNMVADGIATHNRWDSSARLFANWVPVPQKAVVNLTLDGSGYTGQTVELYQNGYLKFTLQEEDTRGIYSHYLDDKTERYHGVGIGTYDIYVNGSGTGRTITIPAKPDKANVFTETLTYHSVEVETTIDNTPADIGNVVLRQDGLNQAYLKYDEVTKKYQAIVLEQIGENANYKYDVYVNSEDAGSQYQMDLKEESTLKQTIPYYNVTLTLTYDSPWTDASVSLQQNGMAKHYLEYKSTDGKQTTYTKLMQGNTGADEFELFINGITTGDSYVISQEGFENHKTVLEEEYYKITMDVQKDDAPWSGASVSLWNGTEQSYILRYDTSSQKYVYNYVHKVSDVDSYQVKIGGSISGSDTGITVGKVNQNGSAEYYSVSYYDARSLMLTQVVKKGDFAHAPGAPYHSGRTFKGWMLSENAESHIGIGEQYNFETPVEEKKTLYAGYSEPAVAIQGEEKDVEITTGYVKCDADGTVNGAGDFYKLQNLAITGYPTVGAPISFAVIEVTNGKVYLTGNGSDENISSDETDEGYAIYDTIDPETGNGNVAIRFPSGATVTEAENFLRTGLVMKVKDPEQDHTLQIRIFGSTVESDTNALTMAYFGLNFDAATFGLDRAVDSEESAEDSTEAGTEDTTEEISEDTTEDKSEDTTEDTTEETTEEATEDSTEDTTDEGTAGVVPPTDGGAGTGDGTGGSDGTDISDTLTNSNLVPFALLIVLLCMGLAGIIRLQKGQGNAGLLRLRRNKRLRQGFAGVLAVVMLLTSTLASVDVQAATIWYKKGICLDGTITNNATNKSYTLEAGKIYYLTQSKTFTGQIIVEAASGSAATLYLEEGVELNITGSNGSTYGAGGKAAIKLDEDATLILRGEGTLKVTGGNGANAGPGQDGNSDSASYAGYYRVTSAKGGNGGIGAGGGGAAIGTNGAVGGAGGQGGASVTLSNRQSKRQLANGNPGRDGDKGNDSLPAGTLIVLDSVQIFATAGTSGNASTSQGTAKGGARSGFSAVAGRGGGGGAGGAGTGASAIGSGGAGGPGGGGGGGGGAEFWGSGSSENVGTKRTIGGTGGNAPNNANRSTGTVEWNDRHTYSLKGGDGGNSGTQAGNFQKTGTYYVSTETGARVTIEGESLENADQGVDPETTKITYYANGEIFGDQIVYTKPDYPNALTIENPTRTGYNFIGWHKESDPALQAGNYYSDWDAEGNGTYYYNPALTNLYAVWAAKISTLTLDTNHSDTVGCSSGTTEVYQKYDSGWYSDSTCTIPLGYKAADGTKTGDPITIPVRKGYDFLGYYDEDTQYINAQGYLIVAPDTNVADDMTLKAKWKPHQYTVTYYENKSSEDTAIVGSTNCTYDEEYDYLTSASKEGYKFIGWSTDRTSTTGSDLGITEMTFKNLTDVYNGTVNYYAIWKEESNAITYDTGDVDIKDGTGPSNGTYMYSATSVTLPKAPVATDGKHFFKGWQVTTAGSAYDGGTTSFTQDAIYVAGAVLPLNRAHGDVTLTAVWVETEGVEARSGVLTIAGQSFEEPRTYATATVEVYQDGEKARADSVELYQDGNKKFAMAYDGESEQYIFMADTSEATGTYDVYVNGKDSGKTVTFGGEKAAVYYQSIDVYTNMNGLPENVESIELKSEETTRTPGLKDTGNYTDNQQVSSIDGDDTIWQVWVDGEDTGKTIQYKKDNNTATVDRYKVTVNVYQDDEPTDRLGRAYLKAGDQILTMSQVQQGQYELLGYSSDTSYEVWFGNNNSGKTVSFSANGNSAEIRYYTVVIKTKVDGSEADVESVEMRAAGSDQVIRPVKSNKGTYQISSLASDTVYQVYVNGEDTGKTVGFSNGNTTAALDFYTLTYDSNSALGSVPQDSKLYLAGQKATILPQGNLHKPDGSNGVTYSFAGWSGSDGNNYTSGRQAVISSKLVLTAQWSASEEAEASWRISGQTDTYYGSLAEAIAVAEATGPAVSITLRKTATLSDFEGTLGISDKLTLESGADLKLVNTTITNLGIINNGSATITSSTGSVLYSKGSISSADHTATENGGSIQVWVTFDANGYGTAPESGYVELKSNISASLKPADIPANRVFDGWARDDEGENLWNCDTDIVTDSMTLFATWSPFTVTVTYDGNGHGEKIPEAVVAEPGTKLEQPTQPTEKGYTFGGWYKSTAASSNDKWNFDNDTVGAEGFTLYAKWIPNEYTVIFDNQGHGIAPEPVDAAYGTTIAEPTAPTETGYTFNGWFEDPDGFNEWDFENSVIPAENVTLYANWSVNQYKVEFDANGLGYDDFAAKAASMGGRMNSPFTARVDYGTRITEPDFDPTTAGIQKPTEPGYDFLGWYADEEGTTPWNFDSNTMPAENIMIYGLWEAKDYKVTFDDNGGTGGSEGRELTVTFATSPEAVTVPTRAGYTFMGYYASEDNGLTFKKQYYSYDGKPVGTWDIPSDTTLYAKWMAGEANVFFDMQGHGDTAIAPLILAEGDLIAEPEKPFEDKSIYVFDGWYTDESFETKWNFATDTVPQGGITLYAKWKSDYADVTFNNNGVGVAPANMMVKIGDHVLFEGAPMSSVEPVLLEEEQGFFSFEGWYTSAACTDDTAWDVAATPVPESGVKLYAKWQRLDQSNPVISGVTEGKTYCGAVAFKVTDDNLKLVTVNGTEVILDSEGSYTIPAGIGQAVIKATDKSKNTVTMTVTVNSDHDWKETSYEWSEDKTQVTATRICKTDESHVETETVNTTNEVTREAVCEEDGERTYTASFENPAFAEQTKTEAIEKLGHDWNEATYEWSADKTQVTATRICKRDESHVETETVKTTDKVTKKATCGEDGERTYTASFENSAFEKQTKTEAIEKLGHDWSGAWIVKKEATATEEGKEETFCTRGCGGKKVRTIPALGSTEEPGTGTLEKDAEVSEAAPIESASLDNSKSELLDAANIFKPEEKTAIQNGEDARVWMEVNNTDERSIPTEDKKKVEDAAAVVMGDNPTMTYFDIELFKQVGDNEKTQLHEPGIPIKVTIQIPTDLLNHDINLIREYKIIRLHTDVKTGESLVETLSGIFDESTGDFTFETDKFSTYAIAYKDVPAKPDTDNDSVKVTGVTLDKHKDTITKNNGTTQLTATIKPENAGNKNVTWTSSDTNIAIVDRNGKVTAVANGTAIITVTTEDGGKTDTCEVTVKISSDNNTGNQEVSNNGDENGNKNTGNISTGSQEGSNTGNKNTGNKNTSNQEVSNNGENNSDNNKDKSGNDANVQDDGNENNTSEPGSETEPENETESETESGTESEDDSITGQDNTDSISSTEQENCFWHWIILAVSILGSIIAIASGRRRKKQALPVLAFATAIELLFAVLGTCYLDWIFAISGVLIILIITVFLYGDKGKDEQAK